MGIWENLGMGGYRGFSRPAARLLQQAAQFLTRKTSPSQRCAASWRSGAAPRYSG